jgi:hypothetical protein
MTFAITFYESYLSTVSGVELAERERGEGVGKEPNHTTAKKAWPSLNHSILSGNLCWHEVSCQTDRPSSRAGQCAGSTGPRARSLPPRASKIIIVKEKKYFYIYF